VKPARLLLSSLCLLLLTSAPVLAAGSYVEGWDDPDDLAGWTPNTVGTQVTWGATGNPGGCLITERPGPGNSIGITTTLPIATGDYAAAGVTAVSFDVNYERGDFFASAFRVRYLDSSFNGWYYPLTGPFDATWHSYHIAFDPTWDDVTALANGWVKDDPAVESFAATMANVYNPEVRIDGIGAALARIDNFQIHAGCAADTEVLAANFNLDAPGAPPNLTLPGDPVGDMLTLNESSGYFQVLASLGTLMDQPLLAAQSSGIGGLDLLGHLNDTVPCERMSFTWQSLAASPEVFFGAFVIRDAGGRIIASLEYRPGFQAPAGEEPPPGVAGRLTYNGNNQFLEVGNWIQNEHQTFTIDVDLVARTTTLSIQGPYPGVFAGIGYSDDMAGVPTRFSFEGGGTISQWFGIDNILVSTCTCECDNDEEGPSLDVTLSRDTLWPPNHKMIEVCPTFDVDDNCDDMPVVELVSATSDEPDNGLGDGDTENDIQITEDGCVLLRSERQGGGDGRTYTLIYCATDASNNTTCDTVYVEVPHDQGGNAMMAGGIAAQGGALLAGAAELALVVPYSRETNPSAINVERTVIGNHLGTVPATRSALMDVTGDRRADLVLWFDAAAARTLIEASRDEANALSAELSLENGGLTLDAAPIKPTPLGLRYETANGRGYLVRDILNTGSRIKLPGDAGEGIRVVDGGTLDPGDRNAGLFTIGAPGRVTVEVFNVLGQKVRTLVDRELAAGSYPVAFDGADDAGRPLSSGIYFTRIQGPGIEEVRRAVIVR
jgi:hypothetical protein